MRLNISLLSAIGLAVFSDAAAATDYSDKAEYVAVCVALLLLIVPSFSCSS